MKMWVAGAERGRRGGWAALEGVLGKYSLVREEDIGRCTQLKKYSEKSLSIWGEICLWSNQKAANNSSSTSLITTRSGEIAFPLSEGVSLG